MGYSHYYYKNELDHPIEKWELFLKDVVKVAECFDLAYPQSINFIKNEEVKKEKNIPIKIGDGLGEGQPPEFTKERICFNGVGEESFDTFAISRKESLELEEDINGLYQKSHWENFHRISNSVKTNKKPYDLLVTATLVLYKYYFKDRVYVNSDYGLATFIDGLDLVNSVLKLNLQINKDIEKSYGLNLKEGGDL